MPISLAAPKITMHLRNFFLIALKFLDGGQEARAPAKMHGNQRLFYTRSIVPIEAAQGVVE
jgi:hypothetical protein